jgi:hypothetical protein
VRILINKRKKVMTDKATIDDLVKQMNNMEKRFDLLHSQIRAITLFLEEHQKVHDKILPIDSELTDEDIRNMVGAPF